MNQSEHISLRLFIESVMEERDRRYRERFKSQEDSIRSVLLAQKEVRASIDRQIDELKSRAGRLEQIHSGYVSRDEAMAARTAQSHWTLGTVLSVVSIVISLSTLTIFFIAFMRK